MIDRYSSILKRYVTDEAIDVLKQSAYRKLNKKIANKLARMFRYDVRKGIIGALMPTDESDEQIRLWEDIVDFLYLTKDLNIVLTFPRFLMDKPAGRNILKLFIDRFRDPDTGEFD